MEDVRYIISEECKDRNFKYDLCDKTNCLTFLTYSVINSIAMSTQYEEITEMYESGVMKKTITLEKPTEVMGGVDPKYSKAANVLGFLLDKSPKDVDKETCELVYSNAIFHPAPDNEDIMACNGAEISEEAYKKIRQSLGFYKQSEVDKLQQKDNK
jgi:hypothetical protein